MMVKLKSIYTLFREAAIYAARLHILEDLIDSGMARQDAIDRIHDSPNLIADRADFMLSRLRWR